jgi:hypothetical protein
VAPAHQSELADESVGLITVAQAVHWFDSDAFHEEAKRVLVPHGIIAEWCYALLDVPSASAVSALITALDRDIGPWWPEQRKHIDDGYANLPFPFTPVEVGTFVMEADWSMKQLLGYLGTWSAVTRHRADTGTDIMATFEQELAAAWGRVPLHRIRWPLTLRVGRHDPPPRTAEH